MKHFRKVCAVLLTALMVAVMLPTFGLFTPITDAAEVGNIENGDFETGDYTGWKYNEWGYSIYEKNGCSDSKIRNGNYSMRIGNHSSVQGATLEQVVPVNTGSSCTLTFYLKYDSRTTGVTVNILLGNTSTTCTNQVVSKTASIGSNYTANSISFDTGNYKYALVQFKIPEGASNDSYLDDVSMSMTGGDSSTHAAPVLVNFGNSKNIPKNDSYNLINQPGFESNGTEWNVNTFIKDNLSIKNSADEAHSGDRVLHYKNNTTTESWHYFDVALPSAGNYVLSAWLKTPYLSKNNQGYASLGVMPTTSTSGFLVYDSESYKNHYSTSTAQLRSTAMDNKWHLRNVTFYVGAATQVRIGVYGKQSEMYIDDIAVFKETNGVAYSSTQQGTLTASTSNVTNKYCESANNLVPDCNMNTGTSKNFWSTNSSGWNYGGVDKGFMSFENTGDSQGNALKYTSQKTGYYYIKWISVEPGQTYTVSFDYKVPTSGSGKMMLLDNNIELPKSFYTLDFSSKKDAWTEVALTFNSGNYNRIAFAIYDNGGTAYFDDIRVFKNDNAVSEEPAEEFEAVLFPEEQGVSKMENTGKGYGVAFRFTLAVDGLTINDKYEANYDSAFVDPAGWGNGYKLKKMGAVMTNKESVGTDKDAFTLDNVVEGDKSVVDVEAKYVMEVVNGVATYGVRVVNVPQGYEKAVIFARPYYVYQNEKGVEFVVYGDIVYDSYAGISDTNDGWMEWD